MITLVKYLPDFNNMAFATIVFTNSHSLQERNSKLHTT